MKLTKVSAGGILVVFVGVLMLQSTPGSSHPQAEDQPVPRELDFPYYSLRGGFSSVLQLVGDSPSPFSFAITVHSSSGQTVVAPQMTVQPGEKLSIDVSTLLTKIGADPEGAFADGSISSAIRRPPGHSSDKSRSPTWL